MPIHSACRALYLVSRHSSPEGRDAPEADDLAVCEGMSSRGSILVVAAGDLAQRTLTASLRAKGFEVEGADRIEDGRRKLETGAHEVAVVNLDIPRAFELLQVRRGDEHPVPIIGISERPTATVVVQAFRAGAVDCLSRPIQRDALVAAVDRAMERARALQSLRGVQRLLGACVRWCRDVETLLTVPGVWGVPSTIREALIERRGSGALDHVLAQCLGAHEIAALTRREREVLLAIAQGRRGRDLARCLGISVHTCRSHTKAVLRKLACRSQGELIERLGGLPRVP